MMFNFSNNHPQFSSQRRLLYLGFSILLITACILPGSVPPTPIVITATSPVSSETPPVATETAPASASATLPITLTASNNVSCTVLQDLNLRSGPGTAYNPPLAVLKEGTEFVPIGFDPQGIPGGPWVQAQIEGISQPGWVSAGSQFISCNLDFASLPVVEVPPPPKGPPPRVGTGAVDGNGIDDFRFSFDYNPDYFVRMYVFRSDDENEVFSAEKDGRGITSVEFIVESLDDTAEHYRRTEVNPGYCIFAGGEPDCNPWIFENGQYKWSAGGAPVAEGNYLLTVNVTAEDGEVGNWFIDITIDLP
ncbi:MAG TPA: SH3 domain-containing protein [Anaerolineales bacterium]